MKSDRDEHRSWLPAKATCSGIVTGAGIVCQAAVSAPPIHRNVLSVCSAARRLGRKVVDLRLNIREPVDLRGIPVPDLETGTTRWLVPDELPRGDDVLISSRRR